VLATAPLARQWDGSQRVSRQFPPGGGHVELIAVSAVSDSDVRALGHDGPGGPLGHTTNCPASSSGLVVATDPPAGQLVPFGTRWA
jgi:hypothetical protein